jgi:mRNA-degrading endonuclease toxin of MazEF toxin-antitoxin module
MDTSPQDLPRRGQVYLANVPCAANRAALQATPAEHPDEPVTGFVAEVRFKLRPVLVVQNDAITAQSGYEYILVAPIYSVKDKHKARPEFELLLTNRLPQVYHLDLPEHGVTRPSYVALAQLQLLHRSMLRERRGALTMTEMRPIDERLRFCLGL